MDLENQSTEIWDSFIGRKIEDRYVIRRKIAEGGIGAVYLAEDTKMMNREVVVKILLENWTGDEEVRRKFDHEKEALSRLDHPGIVSILDAGVLPENKPFIVMPFIAGRTLREVLNEQTKLPLNFCADIVESFCEALETAHAAGILHRDIKPENIILTEQADRKIRVRLIDFGIARVMNSQISPITEIERSIGTVLYIAPEQLLGSPNQQPSADIYSCAIVVYEMLTGKLPFQPRSVVDMWQMQSEGLKLKPSLIRPELNAEVDNVILKAMAYKPTERFQQVLAFGRELAHALRQLSLDSLYNFDSKKSEVTIALTADNTSRLIEETKTARPSFEVKIEQKLTNPLPEHKTQSNEVKNLTAQIENLPPINTEKNKKNLFLRPSIWAATAGFLLLLSSIPVLTYFLLSPDSQTAPPIEPKNTDIVVSKTPAQTLEFYLELQRPNSDKLIRITDRNIFETGYAVKINMTADADGYIYLFNEGKDETGKNAFFLVYPIPAQNDFSPRINAGQKTETDWLDFGDKPGKEIVWLIWTKNAVPELEEIRLSAAENDKIESPQLIEKLQNFQQKHLNNTLEIKEDDENKRTVLQSSNDTMIYKMELEHN